MTSIFSVLSSSLSQNDANEFEKNVERSEIELNAISYRCDQRIFWQTKHASQKLHRGIAAKRDKDGNLKLNEACARSKFS